MHVNRGALPKTHTRDTPVCGRCPKCHPGRHIGGDYFCRALQAAGTCTCHKEDT